MMWRHGGVLGVIDDGLVVDLLGVGFVVPAALDLVALADLVLAAV